VKAAEELKVQKARRKKPNTYYTYLFVSNFARIGRWKPQKHTDIKKKKEAGRRMSGSDSVINGTKN
jgi:hypothetical protein